MALGNGTYRLATSGDTTTTTTFEAGETKIQGLKGEYTITETQAPQDYSSLMLPSAVVTVNVDDTNMTWSLDVKSDPNNLIKKGDSQMDEAVQKAVQKLIDDGTYLKILKYWGVEDGAIETSEINTPGAE